MTDTFNVTAAYDKSTYNQGDTMTITIAGNDVLTTTTTTPTQTGNVTLTITAVDGATTSVNVPVANVNVTTTTTTPESVKITGVVDTSGRTWTIAGNGLTCTALA